MAASSDVVQVEDASADGHARGMALQAGLLAEVGFQPLGVLRWSQGGEEVVVQAYRSRYGDAFAFSEPREPLLRLRILSVLQSGRLVETLALADGPGGRVRSHSDTTIAEPIRRGKEQSDLAAGLSTALDAARLLRDRSRMPVRFPDLGSVGMHRQICDVQDPESMWVAHKGLLRRVQGTDDDVVDHADMSLLLAALRREDHVRQAVERTLRTQARALAGIARNVLLVAPGLLALSTGLTWWASGLIVGTAAAGALLVQVGLLDANIRRFLPAVPVVAVVLGWLTVGILTMFGLLLYGLVVLQVTDLLLVDLVQRALLRARGDLREPAPVPMPQLLELYR